MRDQKKKKRTGSVAWLVTRTALVLGHVLDLFSYPNQNRSSKNTGLIHELLPHLTAESPGNETVEMSGPRSQNWLRQSWLGAELALLQTCPQCLKKKKKSYSLYTNPL